MSDRQPEVRQLDRHAISQTAKHPVRQTARQSDRQSNSLTESKHGQINRQSIIQTASQTH